MGYSDKNFSSRHSFPPRPGHGAEQLEKEAFERGLPDETKRVLRDTGEHTRQPSEKKTSVSKKSDSKNTPAVILLIDDDEQFRTVIRLVLEQADYEVIEASNGEEGTRVFYQQPADMIITDIIMPEKEGIDTIIELKKAYPKLKILAMSGGGWYRTDIDFDMAEQLGARTLDKPFALRELLKVVRQLLE